MVLLWLFFHRLLKLLIMLSLVTKNSHKPFSEIAAAEHFFYCFYLCLLFRSSFLIGIVKLFWFTAITVYLFIAHPLPLLSFFSLLLLICVFPLGKHHFPDVIHWYLCTRRRNVDTTNDMSDQFYEGNDTKRLRRCWKFHLRLYTFIVKLSSM